MERPRIVRPARRRNAPPREMAPAGAPEWIGLLVAPNGAAALTIAGAAGAPPNVNLARGAPALCSAVDDPKESAGVVVGKDANVGVASAAGIADAPNVKAG